MPKKMSMHRGVLLFLILIVGLLFGLTYFEYSSQPAVLEGPADGGAVVGGVVDGSVGGDADDEAGDVVVGGAVVAAGDEVSDEASDEIGSIVPVPETETQIPIIMYHYVREVDKAADPLGWNLSIKPAIFEEQLKWLKAEGYVGVHLEDLFDGKVPEKAVVLSFDDGLEDFYTTALPLLQKYGFTASNAVVTGMVGAHEHMTEEQIRECVAAGIEITSHTVGHIDLSTTNEDEVRRQVTESRDYLEDGFGIDVSAFVYPSGKYNDAVVRILEKEGYKIALTTQPGEVDLVNDDWLLLPRVRIDNRDGLEGFKAKLSGL